MYPIRRQKILQVAGRCVLQDLLELIALLAGRAITSQQVLRKVLARGLLINLEVKTLTILVQSCFSMGSRTNSFIEIIKFTGFTRFYLKLII
jgi:hypothetical protein